MCVKFCYGLAKNCALFVKMLMGLITFLLYRQFYVRLFAGIKIYVSVALKALLSRMHKITLSLKFVEKLGKNGYYTIKKIPFSMFLFAGKCMLTS